MTTRTRPVIESNQLQESFIGLVQGYNQPQNGTADIFWVDAGFIDDLRPDGF
jgi:hypothetical protein